MGVQPARGPKPNQSGWLLQYPSPSAETRAPRSRLDPTPPVPGGQKLGCEGSSDSAGSGSAVTSLILGVVGVFIPVILSVLAIIFGGVGINNANSRGASGKGMAIAGLVLGILGTLGWIGYLGTRGT